MNCKKTTYKNAVICIVESNVQTENGLHFFDQPTLYQNELNKIIAEQKKRDFLYARYGIKQCLNGAEETVLYSQTGKPYLAQRTENISISHCKNWVAVIVHPNRQVGIDIETPNKKLHKVAQRFLSKDEYKCYKAYGEENAFRYLRIIWSAKEALFKIIGNCYNFSQQLHTLPFQIQDIGELLTRHIDTQKTYIVHYLLQENYTLAYCIEDEYYL